MLIFEIFRDIYSSFTELQPTYRHWQLSLSDISAKKYWWRDVLIGIDTVTSADVVRHWRSTKRESTTPAPTRVTWWTWSAQQLATPFACPSMNQVLIVEVSICVFRKFNGLKLLCRRLTSRLHCRVAEKNAESLMHRHFATVCNRITWFSPKCSETITVYQSMPNFYQLIKYSSINSQNWIHVMSDVALHVNIRPLRILNIDC